MPATRTRRATLRDVAEASSGSQSTVSFVLNEVPSQTISAPTRERVQTAARELGYVPHGIARALMEGSSRITAHSEGRSRLAARQALGLDTSDVKTKVGRVIPRESA